MAARSTMAWLITAVRNEIDDGDSTYFTDDEIQDVLDTSRRRIKRRKLVNDVYEKIYSAQIGGFEGVKNDDAGSWSGSPTIALYDGTTDGATEYTPDEWNLVDGTFTFTSDQDEVLFLDAWSYDIHLAAADLLRRLASKTTITPGWGETGGQMRSRDDLLYLAHEQRKLARPMVVRARRLYGI